jgi:hypothetical protein
VNAWPKTATGVSMAETAAIAMKTAQIRSDLNTIMV